MYLILHPVEVYLEVVRILALHSEKCKYCIKYTSYTFIIIYICHIFGQQVICLIFGHSKHVFFCFGPGYIKCLFWFELKKFGKSCFKPMMNEVMTPVQMH